MHHRGESYWPIAIRSDRKIEVMFQWLSRRPPFSDETKRMELRERLNAIPGVDIPADRTTGRPTFPLSALKDEDAMNRFLAVLGWFVREVRGS